MYLHEITNGFQTKRIIDDWIGFYNSERPHISLDTPARHGILHPSGDTKSGMNSNQIHLSYNANLC